MEECKQTETNTLLVIYTSKGRKSLNGYGKGNYAFKPNTKNCSKNNDSKKDYEMKRNIKILNQDVVILTKTKKKRKGKGKTGNYFHIWSGVNKHQRTK